LGGSEGIPAKLDLLTNGTTHALPSKVPHMNIAKAGRFVCYGPAGGGYGNPLERDPVKVTDDVLDEVISIETALKDYSVVVSAKGFVDRAATEEARVGVLADIQALSRLKHGFESRRERQIFQ
jgi:N-methylhydantoinase B